MTRKAPPRLQRSLDLRFPPKDQEDRGRFQGVLWGSKGFRCLGFGGLGFGVQGAGFRSADREFKLGFGAFVGLTALQGLVIGFHVVVSFMVH